MPTLGTKVTIGATWMVAMRMVERSLGFVSTLFLARLLAPEDFGLVAMAMVGTAFVNMFGHFGFDFAIIRDPNPSARVYNSAWSLKFTYGLFATILIVLLAPVSVHYFEDSRLAPIMYVLAFSTLIGGFENIGIVNFRKEFQFNKDFQYSFLRKLCSFVVTIALAFYLRSYWALVIGTVSARVAGVFLSYAMHPYRPSIDFSESRELFNFSKWIVLTRITHFCNERAPDLLFGRFLDSASLGLYRMGKEIATLPTSELIFPIMRAVYPGYAARSQDRSGLARAFLKVQGMLVALALPAGIGVVLIAEPAVFLLLGPKWLGAIPIVQILGLYGAVTVFQLTNNSIFNVLGLPYWGAMLRLAEILVVIPCMFYVLTAGYGIREAALMVLAGHVLMIPVGVALISHLLGINFRQRLSVIWRPISATAFMGFCVWWLPINSSGGTLSALVGVLSIVVVGLVSYASCVVTLWLLSGKPDGAERLIVDKLLICKKYFW